MVRFEHGLGPRHPSADAADGTLADGHLLASPCSLIPHVDSAVVLVAGTGAVGICASPVRARRLSQR